MRTFVLLALLLALFAVLFVPALAQEGDDEGPLDPSLSEGEEVIEEIDTENTQQQAGGRPQMSPEEMERQQKLYQEMIEYVMSVISEPCQGELQTALNTPPEQQTPDMLSAECKGPVNAAAADFQKRKAAEAGGPGGAEGSEGEGGSGKTLPQVEAAPMATYVTILAGALLPLLACCGFAYVSESNKARKLAKLREEDPAAYAREKEEEERKKRREEKKAEKMRRKGKAPVAESE